MQRAGLSRGQWLVGRHLKVCRTDGLPGVVRLDESRRSSRGL